MLERTRVATRRLLTMANLYENLSGIYGGSVAMVLAEPLGYRALSSPTPTLHDCLRFTSLAAEAFINDLDLKKGERVALLIPDPAELVLVAAALVKAGGVAIPLDPWLPAGELADRVRGCWATLAVVDGNVLAERADIAGNIPGVERVMAAGPRAQAPEGFPCLDEAMDSSSGFFLPYTLKPSNVVGVFHTVMGDGTLKAVMATNQGLLGPQRWAVPLFPARSGDTCLCAASPRTMAGFSAIVLGLCAGLRLHLVERTEADDILEILEAEKPAAFLGTPGMLTSVLRAGVSGNGLSYIRLLFSAGGTLPREAWEGFQALVRSRRGAHRPPVCLVEAYDAGGNATALAWKPAGHIAAWPEGCPGIAIPPNRMRVMGETGGKPGRGEEGELAVKGPAVTPGYWNDVEGTLAAKQDGWLRTGIRATKNRYLITLR